MSTPAEARYQDDVVLTKSSPRPVNTRYGQKTVWDIKSQDGRRFQSWDQATGMQAQNLAGQQVRVIYVEKPSSDPQYPPNLELESIQPLGLPGPGAAAATASTAPSPPVQPQAAPQAAPAPAPAPAAAQPLPASHGTPGAGSSGPSQEDKASMRRSAAVKAAAYLCAGDPEIDFWRVTQEILTFIETGNDPIPFSGGEQPEPTQQGEFPPGF